MTLSLSLSLQPLPLIFNQKFTLKSLVHNIAVKDLLIRKLKKSMNRLTRRLKAFCFTPTHHSKHLTKYKHGHASSILMIAPPNIATKLNNTNNNRHTQDMNYTTQNPILFIT
ncbi:hypothetical protein M758_8G195100 [Ceratodon purpureus]|uniref:Uncharacterized protein n=1 Tax=Ceratodon purpureus TaxID=3225 RepID=A0A8T0H497_CERPU|nr:hypothetical protein KC19_8G200300 [Ceratodon purpureus]KAG0609579.1 hypothetical protein M758_8G195100 [Ceratodon purpureus]